MEKNKGLATNFKITKDGAISMSSGEDKVDDNVVMFFAFFGFFRIFLKDFAINIYFIFQRNASIIRQRKNLLQLQILDSASRYIPFSKFEAIDFPEKLGKGYREIGVSVQYGYNLTSLSKSKVVTFLKTI